MKQVLIKGGAARVEDVPAPEVDARALLVRVRYSCISTGTELSGLRMSGLPLYRRALKQPENVRRVLQSIRDIGLRSTMQRVQGKLAAGSPTGYSAAGTVIAVGTEVDGFAVGDRVACAGAGIANHAEVINVPVNLCARVPEKLGLDIASTVTLGAIALQGVRRTAPTLGETIVVVGLGLLGQLTIQMLKANGCRVIGVDLDGERLTIAHRVGADSVLNPGIENYGGHVQRLTDGFGADAAIVTAASASSQVIAEAMHACRKKGRVVVVGDVALNLRREDLYRKELDVLISTSYGPGRYDPIYEEGGQDYPLPYVRWTENRNMEAYLGLLAENKISLAPFAPRIFPIDRASEAYASLNSGGKSPPLLALLAYPDERGGTTSQVTVLRKSPAVDNTVVNVALIGAGSFAQGVHLPNLAKLRRHFRLRAVMSRTGANAYAIAKQYQADYATTDVEEVLADAQVDLVIIATRHHLHAPMVLRSLEAGKRVFVEKPLALTEAELSAIERFYEGRTEAPLLMTGFNRRFSPPLQAARGIVAARSSPLIVNYRMNAGHIPPEHWVHGPEGGGRNIGEACHIYDLFSFLTGAKPISITATSIRTSSRHWARNDNFVATIGYGDGSVCTLTYTALGSRDHPKERMDIYVDGKVLVMDDYRHLSVSGGRHRGWSSKNADKGQLQELTALGDALQQGAQWPISLEEQMDATRVSFAVERAISAG